MRSNYEITGFGWQPHVSVVRRMVMPGSILWKTVRIALGGSHLGVAVFALLLPREEWHMDEICCLAFCRILTAILTGRRHTFMANHLLYSSQVGAGVEQFRDVGSPHVVRREWRAPCPSSSIPQDNGHPRIRQPPFAYTSTAHGSPKQRAGIAPTHLQPCVEGGNCIRGYRRPADP